MQRYARSPLLAVDRLDRELTLAIRCPAHALAGIGVCATRLDDNLASDDECRVEADTELADELRSGLVRLAELLQELCRA